MRAATPLFGCLLAAATLSGCLGIDNMADFKAALGFAPAPLEVLPPVARLRASPTLAAVGQPVAFSAQGSLDPQGAPLAFAWDFGDGAQATGSEVTHRYARPGTLSAVLRAVGAAAAPGTDSVLVTVVENRAPLAAFAVLRGGAPVERGLAGEELEFVADVRDPEGQPVAVRWDFGDGATALTPAAKHTFPRGGAYGVALHAEDPSGLAGAAQLLLPVDQVATDQGKVSLLDDTADHALDVAAGASGATVRVTLADAMFGLNALAVQLLDATGAVVGEVAVQPPPATQGPHQATLLLSAAQLQGHAPGAWTLVVERVSGLQVAYAFTAEVRY